MGGQAWGQQLLGFQESWGISIRSLPAWTATQGWEQKDVKGHSRTPGPE